MFGSRSKGIWPSDIKRFSQVVETTSQKSRMTGGFDLEAFKAELKEELLVENQKMMKELMGEMIKLIQGSQPIPPTDPVDLGTKLPVREREKNEVTVLADPIGRRNVG